MERSAHTRVAPSASARSTASSRAGTTMSRCRLFLPCAPRGPAAGTRADRARRVDQVRVAGCLEGPLVAHDRFPEDVILSRSLTSMHTSTMTGAPRRSALMRSIPASPSATAAESVGRRGDRPGTDGRRARLGRWRTSGRSDAGRTTNARHAAGTRRDRCRPTRWPGRSCVTWRNSAMYKRAKARSGSPS